MIMDPHYGNLIWTKHVLTRLKDRDIKQSEAWATWRRPDNSRWAKNKGAWIFYRTLGGQKIEVVAKKNPQGQWLILSVWSKFVPFEKTKRRSFWQSLIKLVFSR